MPDPAHNDAPSPVPDAAQPHRNAWEDSHHTPSPIADSRTLDLLFRLYKSLLSPLAHAISPTQCLYLPTCSEYAYIALHRFGPWRGSWLALRRLARCHPFAKGGLDPVPDA